MPDYSTIIYFVYCIWFLMFVLGGKFFLDANDCLLAEKLNLYLFVNKLILCIFNLLNYLLFVKYLRFFDAIEIITRKLITWPLISIIISL